MQLKIPFGSSWELLRTALPEWWEYSIPALRAGVSACSGKARAAVAGTRVCLPPGSAAAPPTSRGVDPGHPGVEAGVAFAEVGFQWKDAAEGTRQLHPRSWSSVTPAPCSGCVGRHQEGIICTELSLWGTLCRLERAAASGEGC